MTHFDRSGGGFRRDIFEGELLPPRHWDIHDRMVQELLTVYPGLGSQEKVGGLLSKDLISPLAVPLPRDLGIQAQEIVGALFRLRSDPKYVDYVRQRGQEMGIPSFDPGHWGIFMSYDFHLEASSGELKLIEVNTNAAFFALGLALYQAQELPLPYPQFRVEDLRANIIREFQEWKKRISEVGGLGGLGGVGPGEDLKRVCIMDEAPEKQRLFLEFLIYQELFRSWGWSCQICEPGTLPLDTQFVYNRWTDFYFSSSDQILQRFVGQRHCFSPQPYEYLLLGDKRRMADWSLFIWGDRLVDILMNTQYGERLFGGPSEVVSPEFISSTDRSVLARHLIPTVELGTLLRTFSQEEIWSWRKNLFFKPITSHGSKQAYRGGKMSRRIFEDLLEGASPFVAQKWTPPLELKFREVASPFKMDLRFYSYRENVQLVLARLYQGQVTNSKTKWGGFAPIYWV